MKLLEIKDIEKEYRLFPTTENLRRIFFVFHKCLSDLASGNQSFIGSDLASYRRLFFIEIASKLLSWFSLYKNDIVGGQYFFNGIEVKIADLIKKLRSGKTVGQKDKAFFDVIEISLFGPLSPMIEVNGNQGIQDGVKNRSHIFRGILVTDLPGGSVYEVMKEVYEKHGGPMAALLSNEKIYLKPPQGDVPDKLRTGLKKYIERIESATKSQFPIEFTVSGGLLEVIPRGSNPRKRKPKVLDSKDGSTAPKQE